MFCAIPLALMMEKRSFAKTGSAHTHTAKAEIKRWFHRTEALISGGITVFLAIYIYKCQDRLGTNVGKTPPKDRFAADKILRVGRYKLVTGASHGRDPMNWYRYCGLHNN